MNKTSTLFFVLLSFSATAQQLAPSIIWAKCLGGSRDDKAYRIIKTPDNGFLLVGSSLSNDGDVSNHHGSTDSTDAWVVKLSSSGSIEWEQSYGGSGQDIFTTVDLTNDGNYICMGSSTSNDGDVSGNHGGYGDLWVVKINRTTGSIIWQKCLGGTSTEQPGNIRQNIDGSFFVIGSTSSNDGDVSGINNPGAPGRPDAWVVKLDANGNILWQKCFGTSLDDKGSDILEASNGSYYIAATTGGIDGNMGPLGSLPSPKGYVFKIDSTNTVIWRDYTFTMSAPLQLTRGPGGDIYFNSYGQGCSPMLNNNMAVQEKFTDNGGISAPPLNVMAQYVTFCFGPGPGVLKGYYTEGPSGMLVKNNTDNIFVGSSDDSTTSPGYHNSGYYDGFVSGFKTSGGQISWRKFIGGFGDDHLISITGLNDVEFLVSGYTNSNNGDVSGNHGGYDFWVVKLGQSNIVKGTVFADYNLNGVKDSNEPYLNGIIVESSKGAIKAASSTYQGSYSNSTDTGTWTTKVLSTIPNYTSVPVSQNSTFTGYNQWDSINFAMQPVPGRRDYKAYLFATFFARAGYDMTYKIQYMNNGTDTLQNKQVKLIKDSRLSYLSSVPSQTSVSADTIIWTITNLSPRDTGSITVNVHVPAPPTVNIGDTIVSSVMIDTTGDLQTVDNFSVTKQFVFSSFDPNDKSETHLGSMYRNEYDAGGALTYTIRFQNTGNDTAFNVIVKDTLDPKFDSTTIEMVAASHPYKLTINNGRYCTWTFNNILLLDSIHNEPASHGFIVYRIKPKSSLNTGDSIKNSASIYFDFNPPVKTVTQVTVLRPSTISPPPTPVVDSIKSTYCNSLGIQKGKIHNLPANGSGVTTTAKLDATTLTIAADSTFSFNTAGLTGAHAIQVIFSNSGGTKTTTDSFMVTTAVAPDVNVSSNITTVIDATPITLTASNAAGGGSAPLYTFAIDRNFISILQAESPVNTVGIVPATLVAGDNWFYVQMTTSTNCYTSLYGVDSIKLTRVLAPAQPNLTGLSASYCSNAGLQKGKISNLPSNGSGITVSVMLDANTLSVAADSSFNVDPGTLSAGSHNVNITYTNLAGTKSTAFNFTVSTTVTPDVNVSANITNVTSLATPVIVTASNAAGGGTGPLYTFAKDKAFSNILKAESSSDSIHITPSNLTVGDNWIYVRMKTNATCYTVQTNIDSIDIRRDQSTGIIDLDDPSRIINIYPNPFQSRFTIDGLNAGKIYTVIIYNLQGQVIYQQKVTNKSTIEIPGLKPTAAVYWLSLFDDRKQRLIGTMKLLKQ